MSYRQSTHRHGQSVVLVHNRDDTHVEKLSKGVLGVEVLGTLEIHQLQSTAAGRGRTYVCDIVPRQEYLGHGLSQVAEEAIPEAYEAALADGREGLSVSIKWRQ